MIPGRTIKRFNAKDDPNKEKTLSNLEKNRQNWAHILIIKGEPFIQRGQISVVAIQGKCQKNGLGGNP